MNALQLQRTLQEALTHHRAGQLDRAWQLYAQARRADPRNFDAWHLGGVVAYQQGRALEAVELLTQARRLDSKSPLCLMRLGLALVAAGQPSEGENHLRAALAKSANQPEAWNGLALSLRAQGKLQDAIGAWKKAVQLQPSFVEAHDALGAAIADTQGFAESIPHFRRALELNRKFAPSWCNLGLAYAQTGDSANALSALNRALELAPTLHRARIGRAITHQQENRIVEALTDYEAVLRADPFSWEAHSGRLLCSNYLDSVTADELAEMHRRFGQDVSRSLASRPPPASSGRVTAPSAGRLRLAFLSPDLRNHSVAYFLEPLLTHLDLAEFELVLYHDHAIVDATSERLKARASIWRNFAGQTNDIVETQIRADAPDILVDLAGHTGLNRLPLFARRLAPLQVSYLGYPNTTGLEQMDVRLTDAIADPDGDDDRHYTERLIRFAPTAWVYRPPQDAPEVTAPPCTTYPEGPVTFGSFNNLAKLSPTTVELWARVLHAVTGSRLLLKGRGLENPAGRETCLRLFAAHQISADRLVFFGRTAGRENHLAMYAKIDIALDPLPYQGTTTTCEALWMGRPVITLTGLRHATRVGPSLLTAIQRTEWIARDLDHYVMIASKLASDRKRLVQESLILRDAMRVSPLLDGPAQAQRFALALRTCWSARIAGDSLRSDRPSSLAALASR